MRPRYIELTTEDVLDFSDETLGNQEGPLYDLDWRIGDPCLSTQIGIHLHEIGKTEDSDNVSALAVFEEAMRLSDALRSWVGEWLPDREEKRTARVSFRTTPSEWEKLQTAAKGAGMSVTDYLLHKAFGPR